MPLVFGERDPVATELLPALSHPVGLLAQPELILQRLARLVHAGGQGGQREVARGAIRPTRKVSTRHAGAGLPRSPRRLPAPRLPLIRRRRCLRRSLPVLLPISLRVPSLQPAGRRGVAAGRLPGARRPARGGVPHREVRALRRRGQPAMAVGVDPGRGAATVARALNAASDGGKAGVDRNRRRVGRADAALAPPGAVHGPDSSGSEGNALARTGERDLGLPIPGTVFWLASVPSSDKRVADIPVSAISVVATARNHRNRLVRGGTDCDGRSRQISPS